MTQPNSTARGFSYDEQPDFYARGIRSHLMAIASRELDDRTIGPGEAAYLVKVLDEILDAQPSPGEVVPDTPFSEPDVEDVGRGFDSLSEASGG